MSNPAILIGHLVFWFLVVGYCARKYKGRSFIGWGLAGAVLSALPLFALVFLKRVPTEATIEASQREAPKYTQKPQVVSYSKAS